MGGKVKKRIAILIACAVLAAGMMAVAASLDMPSETIMRWFGASYESLSTMILYVIFCGALGFPVQILVKALPRALLMLHRISMRRAKVLLVVLDTAALFLTMLLVDWLMSTVLVGYVILLLVALVMAVLSMDDLEGWESR
ncbi:YrvL family regulatory protein [uncultured Oscillibacter sp.]|jgi:hypothetical protein|uniref:YrvL family regulatory protein n=1 Tax=uncultured Oscillibacter sp. TaxID=876091 RepID=UPI0025E265D7|nr:YrvL family regulatory protein [uncultured Oscillibacter sp.]MCX4371696.1 YrvL family regulatory protein [Dysosmobacter sp.]